MKCRSLQSCCILEKEQNGDLLCVWTYPCWKWDNLSHSIALLRDKRSTGQNSKGFFYFKHHDTWVYSQEKNDFTILLACNEFDAFKYSALLVSLVSTYSKTSEPPAVLEIYLNALEYDQPATAVGSWCGSHSLKELAQLFNLDVVQIYNALLLKKRLIVYHHSLASLLEWLPVFPRLVRHRDLSNDVRPWIDFVSSESKELQAHSYFLVGCVDNAIFTRTELFDLLVNLPAKELIIARQAKVTKVHKEIAQELEKMANDESATEEKMIQWLADRTNVLLNQMRSTLGQDGTLALDVVTERYSSPTIDFFNQLADSESVGVRK